MTLTFYGGVNEIGGNKINIVEMGKNMKSRKIVVNDELQLF